jgi:hypothetical protein
VQDRVDSAVAAGVVAVADRFAGTLGGRGGQWRGGVEAREPALGEAAGVADLDQQLGDWPGIWAAELCERRAARARELAQLRDDLLLLAIKRPDLRPVAVEQCQAQAGRRVMAPPAVTAPQRGEPSIPQRAICLSCRAHTSSSRCPSPEARKCSLATIAPRGSMTVAVNVRLCGSIPTTLPAW